MDFFTLLSAIAQVQRIALAQKKSEIRNIAHKAPEVGVHMHKKSTLEVQRRAF